MLRAEILLGVGVHHIVHSLVYVTGGLIGGDDHHHRLSRPEITAFSTLDWAWANSA